jgi:membrane protein DedA with SNARE-associated domain
VRHFYGWFMHLPPPLTYLALFLILAVEGIGLPGVPFEPFFLAGGALILHGRLAYWPAVAAGAAGNVLGNLTGYGLARLAGPYLQTLLVRRLHVPAASLAQGERWVRRYGGRAVLLGRWFGPVRTPAILVAGIARLPLPSYLGWSALAALSWTATWQFLAWRFGAAVAGLWAHFGFAILGAAAIVAAMAWLGTRTLRPARYRPLRQAAEPPPLPARNAR